MLENIGAGVMIIVYVVVCILVVVMLIKKVVSGSSYMKQQKETGADKKKVMDTMQMIMGERYPDYTYAVGYFTKEEQKPGKIIKYFYPYILAFSDREFIIFSFLVRSGELIIRNRLDVNWQESGMNFSENKKGVFLRFYIEGGWMSINVRKVIKSRGEEKSDRPLAIYQEQEVDRLSSLLPQYKTYGKYKVK